MKWSNRLLRRRADHTRLFVAIGTWIALGNTNLPAVDYLAEIKPLLQARCYSCHGGLKQEADLRLDTAALIVKGGDSGSAVSQDNVSASLILERITAEDIDQRMPPEHEGEPFESEQVDLIRRWIDQGATGPTDEQPESDPREHWAFQTVNRPELPHIESTWVRNPIDAFIAQQHIDHGLTPQPTASRLLLLRRLSIDLIGLPPTLEQIAAFESDTSPLWYEQTVNRLLNDPRHGERWARHWMDVWRYSDWWGLGKQLRNSQKHIWHWRDWIIESLNEDSSYDEMVSLMLAADELHPGDLEKIRATGYLARNFTLFNRPQWMDVTVEHVGKGLLGLTMNCARCHDHKFDPIEQDDYYRMRAFFEPYHVRLDVVPGEADVEKDGIPRVFDALPDEPTYRYVRGDEKHPDKSAVIPPGVPDLLAFTEPNIQSIELPLVAWQPERQPWVFDAHIDAAAQQVTSAQIAATKQTDDPIAQIALESAQAQFVSVQSRADAARAAWSDASEEQIATKNAVAVKAERAWAVARTKAAFVKAEVAHSKAAGDKKSESEKSLKSSREALDKAIAASEADIKSTDTFTPLIGAKWTPTRFVFSGKDDPTINFIPTSTGRRTALAAWITDRRNPLTARVAVNHIWMRHMGAPLVPTVFDFGRNGTAPTNLELLDYLASELMDNQWSMKHLHRLIVTSNTYRMKSTTLAASGNLEIDPDNQHWWRRVPTRIESQVIRDSLLSLAGTLDTRIGGPPVPSDRQAKSTRRSLYFYHSNNDRNRFLATFDEALVEDCYRREQSIVPQQALALANSQIALEASEKIAERISSDNETEFINNAFTIMLGIKPNADEIAASRQALTQWNGKKPNLIWALINHNDFVSVR